MTDAPTTPQQTGSAVLRRLVLAGVLLVACLGVLDVSLRFAVPKTALVRQTVDIQSPEVLYLKLDALRRFEGKKIVVLGDSLAFGRTMREHGDRDWQAHTLSSQLQEAFEAAHPDQPVMVANLGMNGMLPMDLEALVRIVSSIKPDLIVFDLTLRSFSREFESEKDLMSRPWLAGFSLTEGGAFSSGSAFHDALVNAWYLYRIRDMAQAVAFDGQPSVFVAGMRDRLDRWFRGQPKQAEDEFILLMKARGRYDQIDLAADNPQRMALERMLAAVKTAGQPVLGFYATENKEKLDDLMARDKFQMLQGQLQSIMAQGGQNAQWVGPLDIYESRDYLDHVHLNRQGYERLVQYLQPRIEKAILK